MKDFPERLVKSIKVPGSGKIKLTAPANRKQSCWIGGSTLSSINSFGTMWITKAEFKEFGTNIFYSKSFN